jgi:hypothetical protein
MMVSKSLSIANMLFADVSSGATIKEIYSRCLLLWGVFNAKFVVQAER